MAEKEERPDEFDPQGVVYVRNELGAVHQVSEEHYWNVLHESTPSGNEFILPGWERISESEARKENPAIFGPSKVEKAEKAPAKPAQGAPVPPAAPGAAPAAS